MSSIVFPRTQLGEDFTQKKTPTFNTGIHKAVTGKLSRLSYQAYPLYTWELKYNLLRDDQDGRINFMPFAFDLTQWTLAKGSSATDYLPVVVANQVLDPLYNTLTADQLILNKGAGSTINDMSEAFLNLTLAQTFGTYTASVWLRTLDGSTVSVLLGNGFSPQLVSVTPVWQRFSVTFTTSIGVQAYFGIILQGTTGTGNYANLGVWGAQVEQGSFATPLIATNGAGVVAGDLKTMMGLFLQMMGQQDTFLYQDPDFNSVNLMPFATGNGSITTFPLTATYAPGETYPAPYGLAGLPELIQNVNGPPQIFTTRYGGPELLRNVTRTNLCTQSAFAATWAGTNMTLTANATTGPDGTADAASLNEGVAAGAHDINNAGGFTITGGAYYTYSCYLKYSTHPNVQLIWGNVAGTNGIVGSFNLQTGTVNGVTVNGTATVVGATITPFGNSGWYRCSVTGVLAVADTSTQAFVDFAPNGTPAWFPSYTGTSGVAFAWGAQLEAGTQPTAQIPTTTTSITAVADYSSSVVNVITPAATLANGITWVWSGSFYYRCRFDKDTVDFDEIMNQWWELKTLTFMQVKL